MGKEGKNRKVKNAVLAIAIAAVLLGSAVGSASAIDGCVKIGGNSDDPDDVFTCGETVTESCTFNGIMSCTGSENYALTIGADDIVIDGAGYELIGNNHSWKIGVKNKGYDGVVIKNLIISEFYGYGIWFSGDYDAMDPSRITHVITNCIIQNCTVHDIGTDDDYAQGMYLKGMSDSTIKSNEIYNVIAFNDDDCGSGGNGIFFYGGVKKLGGGGGPASQHNNITCNWLHDNQKAGFFTKMKLSNSNISHNNASGNSWSGILDKPGGIVCRCKLTNSNNITHNNLSNNYGNGLYMGGCYNTIKYNTIIGNSNFGIDMDRGDGSDYNELYHNTVCDNGGADIRTCGPDCYGNHGDCNTCNTTSNYDDDGATGCTFQCGVEEGACVGATQSFTCGDTVTESCTLNGDMSCPAGNGLKIGTDGITIDGNGYAIIGDRSACPTCGELNPQNTYCGILNYDSSQGYGYDNVVIKNLEVKNFCTGILVKGAGAESWDTPVNNNMIINCSVHDNGDTDVGKVTYGIYLFRATNSTITRCDVYNNTGYDTDSCGTGGHGIKLYVNCKHCNITWNDASNNRVAGIFTKYMCNNCTVEYNHVYGNNKEKIDHGGGIVMRCKKSDDWIVKHNCVKDNHGPGIFARSARAIIKHNTVIGSKNVCTGWYGDGIHINAEPATDTIVFNNTLCDNERHDIHDDGVNTTGDCNTCNTTSNYDDDGATGCTFQCGVEEGACVGATQCFMCGDTVTESCMFNGNLTCTDYTTWGLKVDTDNVIIDGNGYKITGNRGASDCLDFLGLGGCSENLPAKHSGIFIGHFIGHSNITIKNLEIEQFCSGISIKSSSNVTVDNCHLHHNGKESGSLSTQGIHMAGAINCTIFNNTVHDTIGGAYDVCSGGGNGMCIYHGTTDSANHLVSNNTLYSNAKAGFFTKACMDNSTITHNTASGNGRMSQAGHGGIVGRCIKTSHNYIAHNNCSDNTGDGVYIGGHYNTIEHNIAKNNTHRGICMGRSDGGSTNNELYSNTVCGNGNKDIYVCFPDGGGNHGDCNTCNSTSNYNDTGTTGCTYECPGETDLTITAKYEQWFGEVYNVIYTITNLGNTTAGESTTGIYIDGTLNKTDPVGLIGPDESYIRTVGPFTMSDDNDTINVTADYENVISETDETNNCLENVFTGVVMPDLVITEKSEAWISLEDKTYNITYTVKNIGNANATESTTAIIIDGAEAETDHVELLAPQATHTAESGPFIMSDEIDTIRICADNESAVEESNEDNNCLQNTFEHPGVPDLVISKKFEEWVASNETWRNYTVTYTVKNTGTGDAGASTTAITIDGAEVANDSVGALGEGESYTNTLGPFTMTADDSDTIKVCAVKDNDVEESNEDNNCLENVFEYSAIGCLAEDGTLFRCGNTVTKNCTFNGDMSCPFTDGLELGANSITINGNNSVLDGTGCTLDAMSRSGIYNQGYDDVTIKDLEVKGFCHGMYFNNVYRNTIEHCDIHHNGNASTTAGLFGITMKYVYNSTIRNNSVHHQIAGVAPNPGCEDGGNGMFLYKGNYNNITENKAYNNTKGGIFIKMQPMHNNITHNELWDNGQGGIILRCMMSNYNYIEHNNASNNYGSGMFIGAKENTIRYNTICDNRDGGPYYQDSVGGHGYGINLGRSDGSFDNYLHDNEICGNDYKDIYVVSGVTGNHGVNNTCDTTYNYDDTGTTGCTYPCAPGVCGDVDGLPGVTTNDGRQIFMYLLYGPEQYPIHDLWAADCDGLCDGITTNDGRQIFMNLLYGEEEYPLVCC